jgi:hypothetical protein
VRITRRNGRPGRRNVRKPRPDAAPAPPDKGAP